VAGELAGVAMTEREREYTEREKTILKMGSFLWKLPI
jgi:hypothetical protein